MNLRYYLRGLGIGIIVTAIIMGITSGKDKTAPDHIGTEAHENGQDSGVLADLGEGTTMPEDGTTAAMEPEGEADPEQEVRLESGTTAAVEPEGEVDPEQEIQPEDGTTAAIEPENEENPEEAPAGQEEQTSPKPSEPEDGEDAGGEEATEGENPKGDTIVIVIAEGDSSYAVSRKLEEAGMIASATAFDRYLYDNGYDRKLRAGTYEISVDTEPEDIAKILAGQAL